LWGWSIYHEKCDGYHPGCKSTTLDSWVVATLGFNMDIEVVSYPAVCAGGLILILFVGKHIDTFPIFFWIWFIVYRLSFMKTAMEAQVKF
jgi:phosphate:Na+ symporter